MSNSNVENGLVRQQAAREAALSLEGAYKDIEAAKEARRQEAQQRAAEGGSTEAADALKRLEDAGLGDSYEASMWRMRAGFERSDNERKSEGE